MKKNIRVAITGGIGSGKSLVTGYIEKLGYPVIKADDIAKELMQNDDVLRKKIIKAFGNESYNKNGLDRKYLAENVFSDKQKLGKINSIVHPATIKKIEQLSKQLFDDHPIVFVESALVYEAKIQKNFDYIILVYSGEEIRISRSKDRGILTEADIKKRMKFQIPDEKKTNRAHFVIDNNSSIADLEERTKFVIDILKSLTT